MIIPSEKTIDSAQNIFLLFAMRHIPAALENMQVTRPRALGVDEMRDDLENRTRRDRHAVKNWALELAQAFIQVPLGKGIR